MPIKQTVQFYWSKEKILEKTKICDNSSTAINPKVPGAWCLVQSELSSMGESSRCTSFFITRDLIYTADFLILNININMINQYGNTDN